MERRQAEYSQLAQKADEFLADRSLPVSPNPFELILQLLIQPAFHNHISWTVFGEENGSTRLARQVIWDKIFDGDRFFNPLAGLTHGWHTWPTIDTQSLKLDYFPFDALVEEGRKYASGAEPQSGIVLDGVQWSVYFPGYFEDRIVTWNGSSSAGKEFIVWSEKLYDFLSAVFDTKLD
jgi:hypothetical protein